MLRARPGVLGTVEASREEGPSVLSWLPIAGMALALVLVAGVCVAGVRAPRRCVVPLIGGLALLLTSCGGVADMISNDPQGHLEPGDAPEGAPDNGDRADPTESSQRGRLQPGDPEAPRGELDPWEEP